MQRGRGTLEVKPSNNPFFQTTSSVIGQDLSQRKQWEAPEVYRPKARSANDGYFDFMFTKESEMIGQGIPMSESQLSTTLRMEDSLAETARKKGTGLYPAEEPPPEHAPPPKPSAEEVLAVYQHKPKEEHPVYKTSNSVIGQKKPDVSTFTHERAFVSQNFSNSFNNIKYRNQGLNTSLTRSNIHGKLDPQFL